MFPYDGALVAAVRVTPQSISEVLKAMQTIDTTCVPGDGLKWFNSLYMHVTQQVETHVAAGGFKNAAWLAALDVQFAALYFDALSANLSGLSCPGCWSAMLSVRHQTDIARIQFAFAGMNAHIDHDLPLAIVATCKSTNTPPRHRTPEYDDYTSINSILNGLIDSSRHALGVRLLGDALPVASRLEDTLGAWDLAAARDKAWNTAEALWREPADLIAAHMDILDGLTTVIGKALLVPVPASLLPE